MRRLDRAREHLDGALPDPAVLDGNLRDLRRINHRLGGADLSIRAVRALVATSPPGGDPLRVIDVGTGAADIPVALTAARGPWRSVEVTAVDGREEVIAAARRVTPELAGRTGIRLLLADGRSLPFGDGEFDVAHASLVLHHLDRDDATGFLRELRRVARLGVVVNDLQRGAFLWLGAWLVVHAITRNRYTLHDGPLSVRRAFTRGEMRELLAGAGLRPVAEVRGFAGHRWAIAAAPSVSARAGAP